MSTRSNVLPDERFVALRPALEERVLLAAHTVTAENFPGFLDAAARDTLLHGFRAAGAHEGTVWLADATREHLVAAFNSGPRAGEIAGHFRQSLRAGMISLVFASEQPLCENEVHKNERQDKTLDRQLGLLTVAMMAVPFYFARELRGVISCVRLKNAAAPEADPPPFSLENLRALQSAAAVVSKLLDHRLLCDSVGWGAA